MQFCYLHYLNLKDLKTVYLRDHPCNMLRDHTITQFCADNFVIVILQEYVLHACNVLINFCIKQS